jgi:hypothetical protein
MVLYAVIRPARQYLGKLRPSTAERSVSQKEQPFFVGSPLLAVDDWTQMVVPALSALFAHPIGQVLGYVRPLVGAEPVDSGDQQSVLLLSPRLLGEE